MLLPSFGEGGVAPGSFSVHKGKQLPTCNLQLGERLTLTIFTPSPRTMTRP